MKQYIVGNWKMNLHRLEALSFVEAIKATLDEVSSDENTVVGVAPPYVYLSDIAEAVKSSNMLISAQNVAHKVSGAFTGEISPSMLQDIGIQWTIIGHSERRLVFQESDERINEKIILALHQDLKIIFCIGEHLEERENNQLEAVLHAQLTRGLESLSEDKLSHIVLAYEPVWAIGTDRTASSEQANEAHASIREILSKQYSSALASSISILYGGSVNKGNARSLLSMSEINGVLIGGASLKKDEFCSIIRDTARVD